MRIFSPHTVLDRLIDGLPNGHVKRIYHRLGLHLLVAFVGFGLAAAGFAKLANEVRENDTLGIDRRILEFIHTHLHTSGLDMVIPVLTNLGGTIGIIVLTAIALGIVLYRRRVDFAALILGTVGGAVAMNLVLKSLFGRVRPELWDRLVIENNFSFPSGHAMASSALAFAVVAVCWRTRWRWPAVVVGGLYMVFIAFTRLYLGVHYPTDIVGGWLVSFAWALIVSVIVYKRLWRLRNRA